MKEKLKKEKEYIKINKSLVSHEILNKLDFDKENRLIDSSIYSLDKEEIKALGISILFPETFNSDSKSLEYKNKLKTLKVEIRETSPVRSKDFSIRLNYLIDGVLVDENDISKSLLVSFGQFYLIPENVYRVRNFIEDTNVNSDDPFVARSRLITQIQSLVSNSNYFELSQYLKDNIFNPINPSLRINITESNEAIVTSGLDGVDKAEEEECLEKVRINPEIAHVKQNGKLKIIYNIPDSKKKVFKKIHQLEKYIKKNHGGSVSSKNIPRLLKDIKQNLGDEIDLTELADRIKGWGIFLRRELPQFRTPSDKNEKFLELVFPCIDLEQNSFIDDDKESHDIGNKKTFDSLKFNGPEENQEFLEFVKEAEKKGEPFVEYKKRMFSVEPYEKIMDALEKNRILLEAKKEKSETDQKRLLAKYNIDFQQYRVKHKKDQEIRNYLNGQTPRFLKSHIKKGQSEKELKLFDYQKEGINWFIEVGNLDPEGMCGGLLADVMGLGKTLQTIAYLACLSEYNQFSKGLIVCPKTLVENWKNEFDKFIDKSQWDLEIITIDNFRKVKKDYLKTLLRNKIHKKDHDVEDVLKDQKVDTKNNKSTVIITTYPQIKLHYELLTSCNFDVLVCDEAQEFKNPGLLLHNALECLKAKRRFALTGTPVENRLSDLWSIMDIVKPGLLGTLTEFHEEFEKPLQSIPDKGSKRESFAMNLREKMGLYFFRRTKKVLKDGGELKECYDKESFLPCNNELLSFYKKGRQRVEKNRKELIGVVQDLRLRSSNVTKYPEDQHPIENLIHFNVKLPWLFEKIDEIKIKNEKLLIFEHFNNNILFLKKILENKYQELCPIEYINQKVTGKNRIRLVEEFESKPDFDLLLLTPRTAGLGLNLISANHVIHFTREWNPAKEAQATDRAYRCGQKKDVMVYYPITVFPKDQSQYEGHETIEEKVHQVLTDKKQLLDDFTHSTARFDMDYVFNGSEGQDDSNQKERDLKKAIGIDETFNYLGDHEFEAFCTLLLEQSPTYDGCEIILTSRTGDKGVDIIAKREKSLHLFECKRTRKVGNSLQRRGIEQISTASLEYTSKGYEILSKTIITNAENCSLSVEESMERLQIKVKFFTNLSDMIKDSESITLEQVQDRGKNRRNL